MFRSLYLVNRIDSNFLLRFRIFEIHNGSSREFLNKQDTPLWRIGYSLAIVLFTISNRKIVFLHFRRTPILENHKTLRAKYVENRCPAVFAEIKLRGAVRCLLVAVYLGLLPMDYEQEVISFLNLLHSASTLMFMFEGQGTREKGLQLQSKLFRSLFDLSTKK